MKLAAMQPTYLPWAGYFNLVHQSDIFIFHDDVQYEKQSWQSRNRILESGKARWLSVPVKHAPHSALISEITISDASPWHAKHARILKQNYAMHPFYRDICDVISIIESNKTSSLAKLTMTIIKQISKQLGLHRQFAISSELGIAGARSEKLLSFCKHFDCSDYLSPAGSETYLAQDGAFDRSDVSLRFQEFYPQPYQQRGALKFVPYLSILDVLANLGAGRTCEYIQQWKT